MVKSIVELKEGTKFLEEKINKDAAKLERLGVKMQVFLPSLDKEKL